VNVQISKDSVTDTVTSPKWYVLPIAKVGVSGVPLTSLSMGHNILNNCLDFAVKCTVGSGRGAIFPIDIKSSISDPQYSNMPLPSVAPRRLHAFGYLLNGTLVAGTQATVAITRYDVADPRALLVVDFTDYFTLDAARVPESNTIPLKSFDLPATTLHGTLMKNSGGTLVAVACQEDICDCTNGCVYDVPVIVNAIFDADWDKPLALPMYFLPSTADHSDPAVIAATPRYMALPVRLLAGIRRVVLRCNTLVQVACVHDSRESALHRNHY